MAADLIIPTPAWYARDVREIAPDLLGAELSVRSAEGTVTARLTEVEAYAGELDPGSHAYRGRTARNATMFGPPGHLYVYFTYGMHYCANLVVGPEGVARGVLLRAGEIIDGVALARDRRPTSRAPRDLGSGPARLATALGLGKGDDGTTVEPGGRAELWVPTARTGNWRQGPRTGVRGAGGDAERFPWRFWLEGEPSVSRYRAA